MVNTALQIIEGYGKLAGQELGLLKKDPKGAERFAKCVACPFLKGNKCTLCSCHMPAKVLVTNAYCPKGLWQ
jgi:hypothetical protein